MYPAELIDPIREEIAALAIEELPGAAEVEAFIAQGGPALLFINSVCGCAAGAARPGLGMALDAISGLRVGTVFAGVDPEATAAARSHFAEYPPSSPSFVLFVDGEVDWIMHRHQIEGRRPEEIADRINAAFTALID